MSNQETVISSESLWPEDAAEDEAVITNWFVSEGSAVDRGTTLREMQVEKVSVDIVANTQGEVDEIMIDEGGELSRGDPLARLMIE